MDAVFCFQPRMLRLDPQGALTDACVNIQFDVGRTNITVVLKGYFNKNVNNQDPNWGISQIPVPASVSGFSFTNS